MNIQTILSRLSVKRLLFHSEADFQHALAWGFHQQFPDAQVRLELPVNTSAGVMHVDLWMTDAGDGVAIELKYKTNKLTVDMAGEHYALKSQSAQDLGRYDFLKDLERLEYLADTYPNLTGYAIFLTNDSNYWTNSTRANTVDASYRLNEGRQTTGTLSWGSGAKPGTIKNREKALILKRPYTWNWQDYSETGGDGSRKFRMLVVRVTRFTTSDVSANVADIGATSVP